SSLSNASSTLGSPVALDINAALQTSDGSQTLTIQLSGVPTAAKLDDARGDTLTPDGNGDYTLTPDQLNGLTLTGAGSTPSSIGVTAIATDASGNESTASGTIQVVGGPSYFTRLDIPGFGLTPTGPCNVLLTVNGTGRDDLLIGSPGYLTRLHQD